MCVIQCCRCKQYKPKEKFNEDKSKNNRASSYCKKCKIEYDKEYRNKNRETLRKKGKIKNRKRRQTPKGRYESYVHSAKQRSINFNLSFEQFRNITNNKCHYCLKFSQNKNHCGIDRLKNDIGYILENCLPCCNLCNFMKKNLAIEQWLSHMKLILKTMKNKNV